MSTEEFICCDAPDCSTAERVGESDIDRWTDLRVTVVTDDEGHIQHLEGHACSQTCVGPAAQALYDQWAEPDETTP